MSVCDDRGDGVDARVGRLALAQSGAGHLAMAQARDRGADHAREGEVGAGQVGAGDAPLLVGVGAELDVDRRVEQAVVGLDAVARRVDAVPGALVVVDGDRAGGPERDARPLGHRGLRPDAGGDDDVVGGDVAVGGAHAAWAPVGVQQDLLEPDAQTHVDVVALGGVLHVGGHVGIERGHQLRRLVDQRHAQVALRPAPRPSPVRCSRRRRPPRRRRRAAPGRAGACRRRSCGRPRSPRCRGSAAAWPSPPWR